MGRHKVSLIYSIEIGSELTCTCYLLCSVQLTKNFTKDELQTIQRGAQLTDIHIQAAQVLIRREFPNIDGLQDPVLGDGNHYIPNVNEGMQIHHINGNHWVTSSSVGGSLTVYDSKISGDLSSSLQCQLATIYKLLISREEDGEVVDPHITVHVPNIPQQEGIADCGVYAIAYAWHAARGDNLEEMIFEQGKMRDHLVTCFRRQKLTPFPHSKRRPDQRQAYPMFPYREIEVFCTCDMPECLDNMIMCDGCEEWFHLSCVGLKAPPPDTDPWHCRACIV